MISRLSAIAATFAILATASLGLAANAHQAALEAAKPIRTVQLQHVVVVAKRLPQSTH